MKRLIGLAGLAALALSGCQKADDAAFGARVRSYLLEHPEVIEEVAVKLRQKQVLAAAKGQAPVIARLRGQLENDPRDLVVHPAGEITVVEFFDYRCGYCKRIAPDVLALIEANPDIRFVFKEFPIFGEVSETAARVALTAPAKAKGLELHRALMTDRALDETAIDRHLKAAGLDPAGVRRAAADPAIDRQILDVRTLAGALGLEGTPAFIVGDFLIPGADIDALKSAIAQTRDARMKRPSGNPT